MELENKLSGTKKKRELRTKKKERVEGRVKERRERMFEKVM